MDPNQDPTGGLDQQAIDAALNTYNQASAQYNNAAERYQSISTATNEKGDPAYSQGDIAAASNQLNSARTQLGTAARAYSTLLGQVANQRAANARTAKDPNEQRLWANEADKATAQRDLYSAEADMYQAKTQADIDNATTRANTALQRANSYATRVSSQNDLSQAQTLLANAKAATIPALSQSTIQLHQSQIQKAAADANLATQRATQLVPAQADLAEARAAFISGPQAQQMVATGELKQAEADWIKAKGGATLAELQAKAGLDDARTKQIYASIGKQQVLPYQDKTSPTLDIFQPSTGQVTGVQNPGYVNQTLQGITDTNQAIQSVQNQIASGQITPDDGTALIQNLRQALQYRSLGVTPDQYLQAQQQQAQLGMGVLNNYMGTLSKGQDVANQFLSAARGIRNMPAGVNFTPFSTFGQIANQVYGPSLATAQSLINQVQPVSDRFSALKAFSQLSQVRQHLQNAQQQSGDLSQGQPGGMDAVQNATDQAGGQNPTTGVMPQQLSPAMVGQ